MAVAPRFPVPPLDLPHYHGLAAEAEAGPESGVAKEVTGAGS